MAFAPTRGPGLIAKPGVGTLNSQAAGGAFRERLTSAPTWSSS